MILQRSQLRPLVGRAIQGASIIALLLVGCAAAVWVLSPFPIERLETQPISPIVTDRTGTTLLRLVASDDHWREPVPLGEMSDWLIRATVAVEDARFFAHAGIDPLAVGRAAFQNALSGEIESGASTITMQLCRMLDTRPRTAAAKVVESFRALQIEAIRTKEQVLEAYLNMAPYGGNVKGVEAASRIYFGKPARDLNLSEASLLAGLPQSPSRFRPDRHLDRALHRRDTVLMRMLEEGFISQNEHDDARSDRPFIRRVDFEPIAPHAAWMALARRSGRGGSTTIDAAMQREVEQLCTSHKTVLAPRCDLAVVVIEIASGDIVALVGSADSDDLIDGQVNGAIALRSPGSALKPFIYAAAFEARRLAPDSILHDVPIIRGGWSPHNFDGTFSGEILAADALQRSLNVPAILITEAIGVERCAGILRACGVPLSDSDGLHAGLTLATGGVEVTLIDLTNAYATLGRDGVFQPPRILPEEPVVRAQALHQDVCRALNSILSSHSRSPNGPLAHRAWFMWKTGTSSRRRDAWAVGHNGKYAVGVWIGRFDGVGEPLLSGPESAEPLLAATLDASAFRASGGNTRYDDWIVSRPISPPRESSVLAIVEPDHDAVFHAPDGAARIRVQATQSEVRWFIDGRLRAPERGHVFTLPQGTHNVRCVNQRGDASAITITVR